MGPASNYLQMGWDRLWSLWDRMWVPPEQTLQGGTVTSYVEWDGNEKSVQHGAHTQMCTWNIFLFIWVTYRDTDHGGWGEVHPSLLSMNGGWSSKICIKVTLRVQKLTASDTQSGLQLCSHVSPPPPKKKEEIVNLHPWWHIWLWNLTTVLTVLRCGLSL